MNPLDLHNFFKLLLAWDVERLTALSTGLVLGAFLAWTLARSMVRRPGKHDDSAWDLLLAKVRHLEETLKAREAALQEQRTTHEQQLGTLRREHAELLQSAHGQSLELARLQQERPQLLQDAERDREEVRSLNQRLQAEWTEKQSLQSKNWQLEQRLAEVQRQADDQRGAENGWQEKAGALQQQNAELQGSLRSLQKRLDTETQRADALSAQGERFKQSLQQEAAAREAERAVNVRLEQQVSELRRREAELGGQAAALARENGELQTALRAVQERLDGQGHKVRELSEQCEQLKELAHDEAVKRETADQRQRREAALRVAHETEAARLREKIGLVTDLNGRVWELPVLDAPAFRDPRQGGARLISVANLKGGVGKTTITANLGAALANRGYRVLLVDLDFQQSLTTLCLRDDRALQVRKLHRFVRNLFSSTEAPDEVAWNNLTDVPEPIDMHLLATDEWLADAEERAKFEWLLQPGQRDVRYLFRTAFHSARFQQEFDVILFDCPPRLTTACVNALAASDFVVIPALLDTVAAQAVPRFLRWLDHLHGRGVWPNLNQAGVIGNGAKLINGHLTRAQQDVLHQLRGYLVSQKLSVQLFDQVVPHKSKFAEAAEKHSFAALDRELQPVFANLVTELLQRKVIHESPRLATVP